MHVMTVTGTPLVGSNPHTRNGRSLGKGALACSAKVAECPVPDPPPTLCTNPTCIQCGTNMVRTKQIWGLIVEFYRYRMHIQLSDELSGMDQRLRLRLRGFSRGVFH